MRGTELVDQLKAAAAERGTLGSQVMILAASGELLIPEAVVAETHDDGSTTLWIKADWF